MQIDSKLYERQDIPEKVTNFQNTLPDLQSDLAFQTMKDPYLFDFIFLKGKVKEIEIEKAMINRIRDVLIELGNGFAFVGLISISIIFFTIVCGKVFFVFL